MDKIQYTKKDIYICVDAFEDLSLNLWNSKVYNFIHFELCLFVGVKGTSDATLIHKSLVIVVNTATRVGKNKDSENSNNSNNF